ncbi:FAD dependent oxidoreductase [Xylariaceae sp. FL1272]|nr:FAD dependent oxidoreductase [Xylariaceae sp. FL1272]
MTEPTQRTIYIIGGGAIGCCAAYYLSHHPLFDQKEHSITLIEATKIAGGASGKAAGCLGAWADPACLGGSSFRLHAQLAADHDGGKNWGYRKCLSADCDAVQSHPDDPDSSTPVPKRIDWVDHDKFRWFKPLGESAQCHPYLFTTTLARLAEAKGVSFVEGFAESLVFSEDRSEVKGFMLRSRGSEVRMISATDIILATGPWTGRILPGVPISGEKSHSVVIKPEREISPDIIFFDPGHIDADDKGNQLEMYPRPDATVYMSGQTDYGLELPPTTDDVQVDYERCKKLLETAHKVPPGFVKCPVLVQQACFRPMVNVEGRDPELGPLLGPTGVKGLLLAAGHNQWGIQNSPITGKVLSELVFEGKAISADIAELDPRDHLRLR